MTSPITAVMIHVTEPARALAWYQQVFSQAVVKTVPVKTASRCAKCAIYGEIALAYEADDAWLLLYFLLDASSRRANRFILRP